MFLVEFFYQVKMEWQPSPVVNPVPSNMFHMNSGGGFYPNSQPPPTQQDHLMMKRETFSDYREGGGGGGGGSYMNNRGTEYAAVQHVPETNGGYMQNAGGGGGYYSEEAYPSYYEYPQYAPCDGGPGPWNFNYCYGFFGEPPCPYANVIDMEDFM